MVNAFRSLYAYRELLWMWTLREIKVRYKQSILGGAWAILQPLSLMVIFSVVFSVFLEMPTDDVPYPIFAYTALLPWIFFSTSILSASNSLINNLNLVTKIYFPRDILPIGNVGAGFFDFIIASFVLVLMMIFYQVPFRPILLWVPLLIVIQLFLMLGVSLGFAALIVVYRDLRFVVPLLLQLWFFATPVIYPVSAIPDYLLTYYMLNPMAALINSYRRVILAGLPPQWIYLLICALVSLIIYFVGYGYFKRVESTLADVI